MGPYGAGGSSGAGLLGLAGQGGGAALGGFSRLPGGGARRGQAPALSKGRRFAGVMRPRERDEEGREWDKKIDDAVKKWHAERDVREKFVKIFRHGRMKEAEIGTLYSARGKATAPVNLCYQVTSIFTALLGATLPTIEVNPRRGEGDALFAEGMEEWLKYAMEETDGELVQEVVIFDAILRGIAWSKESFDPQRGMDVADAVSPLEIHVDPLARYSLAQARFIIQKVVKPIEEARAFFNRNDIEPNYRLADSKEMSRSRVTGGSYVGEKKDLLQFYEIWAKRGDERLLSYRVRDRSEWIERERRWPFVLDEDEWPFSPLMFNTDFNGIDGFSEQEVVDQLQQEINELAEFDRRHTRRAAAKKVLYDSSRMDEDAVNKLLNPHDMEFVGVKGDGNPIQGAVHLLDFNSETDQQRVVFERAKSWHNEIIGLDEMQRAATQKKLTAEQARIIDEFAKLRVGKRQRSVDRWMTQSLRHRAQIARLLVDPEKIARVISPKHAQAWQVYAGNARDLVREYTIRIKPGSTGERFKQQEIQRSQERFALFERTNSALMQSGGQPRFDLAEAALDILRAGNERDPEKYLLPEPAPQPQPGVPEQPFPMGGGLEAISGGGAALPAQAEVPAALMEGMA